VVRISSLRPTSADEDSARRALAFAGVHVNAIGANWLRSAIGRRGLSPGRRIVVDSIEQGDGSRRFDSGRLQMTRRVGDAVRELGAIVAGKIREDWPRSNHVVHVQRNRDWDLAVAVRVLNWRSHEAWDKSIPLWEESSA